MSEDWTGGLNINRAHEAGWAAAKRGDMQEHNPYQDYGEDWWAWLAGWRVVHYGDGMDRAERALGEVELALSDAEQPCLDSPDAWGEVACMVRAMRAVKAADARGDAAWEDLLRAYGAMRDEAEARVDAVEEEWASVNAQSSRGEAEGVDVLRVLMELDEDVLEGTYGIMLRDGTPLDDAVYAYRDAMAKRDDLDDAPPWSAEGGWVEFPGMVRCLSTAAGGRGQDAAGSECPPVGVPVAYTDHPERVTCPACIEAMSTRERRGE